MKLKQVKKSDLVEDSDIWQCTIQDSYGQLEL